MPFFPDIQTYREDRQHSLMTPASRRSYFMGRNFFDQLHARDSVPMNVTKIEEGFRLEIGLPGFARDQVEVSVANDVLTIRATKEEEHTEEGEFLLRELHTESVERRLSLPPGLGKEDIHAKFENGLLRLTITDLPKDKEQAVKTIPVE